MTRKENNAIIPHEIVFAGKAILVLNEKKSNITMQIPGTEKTLRTWMENEKTELIFSD